MIFYMYDDSYGDYIIKVSSRIQKQQLQEILQLMQSSQNQYGIDSIDDMEEQMKLYAIGK